MTDTITPRLKLVDGQGNDIGTFMVEMVEGENEFKFAVPPDTTLEEDFASFDANIVFPKNFTTRDSDGQHDPVMIEVSAVSLGDGSRAEVDPGDME